MDRFRFASLLALSTVSLSFAASDARACGGTFCDVGPTAMPVDQTGENILFVIDEGFVEAHVQIQYQGDPAKFAWIVPMPAVPAVNVGSQALFTNLLQATVPTYGFSTQQDQCGGDGRSIADSAGFGGATSAPNGDPGLVVTQKTVGSFETFTLEGGTTQEIIDWLTLHEFQQDVDAPPILDRYVQDGFVFVAIRLTAGAGLDEIHPLVFRYQGSEPCVPIELTAIAATEDMGLRAFFLGTERVVPSNYRHVTLNPIQIDWQSFGSNYNTVVTRAADSEGADGQAFVTEYSGQSNVVSRGGLFSASWDSAIFMGIDPTRVIDELRIQGLVGQCDTGFCQYNHPMILPLLQQYLPRPAGITEEQFYSCLSCYTADINLTAWSDVGFATALQQQIIDPGRNADDLLARMPHLTRMFTTISPGEMTEDPLFHPMADLDDVALPTMANQHIYCNGLSVFELPSGEQVALEGASWPDFSNLPYAATVEQFSPDGQRVMVTDNTEAIDKELADHNAELGFGDSGGCGCAVPGRRAPDGALAALALAAAALLRRRK